MAEVDITLLVVVVVLCILLYYYLLASGCTVRGDVMHHSDTTFDGSFIGYGCMHVVLDAHY